jgi:hypothetical protein
MTNPAAAMRMLLTYAVCIPVAILVGYLLTNPLDYGTLGFFGLIIAILISPLFIKWHYQLLVFSLASPIICFFIVGRPPLFQAMTVLSLGITITERILMNDRRSISVPVMAAPLLFLAGVIYLTAELTGGFGLQSLGGGAGGGRKYIDVFTGAGMFFAIVSRTIAPGRRNFYLALFFLPGLLSLVGDLFPFLPSPLNRINLLIPPTISETDSVGFGVTRLSSLAHGMNICVGYMLARYGMSGIFSLRQPGRVLLFTVVFGLSLMGGYRNIVINTFLIMAFMFFFEGMHRTRLLPMAIMAGVMFATLLVSFSDKMPFTVQRSMSFLPLKWTPDVVISAEGSSEWRLRMWRDLWPKVPQYLLLGKGYTITEEDYNYIGQGAFANLGGPQLDNSQQSLAISSDYHSGPLSTLIPFGIWGAIGMVWLMGATLFVLYRNYQYGPEDLRVFNIYLLVSNFSGIIAFFFIFGAFHSAVGGFGLAAGFSIAMNGGLAKRPAKSVSNPLIKPRPQVAPMGTLPMANGQSPI